VNLILRSFFRGLLFVVPVGLTVYILYHIFVGLDQLIDTERWLGFSSPGLGAVVTLVAITLVGMLASSFLTRWVLRLMERLFERVPIAKLLYSSIKDLMEAFVGEKKKFDRPVLVSLGKDRVAGMLGFVTRDDLEWLGREDDVAVYLPQSYNFAGQVLIVPRDRVAPVNADSSAVMKFIVSGGVSG